MEKPHKHHELIRPLREIVRGVGEFVVDRVVPSAVVENLFSPPEARGAEAMLSRHLDREHEVGHQLVLGEITAEEAYERLGE